MANYRQRFERLRAMSLEGDQARMLIDTVLQDMPDPARAGQLDPGR